MNISGELIGVIFGDGSICKHGYEVKVSLGIEDQEYSKYLIKELLASNLNPKLEKRKTNELAIRVWNKSFWIKINSFFLSRKKETKNFTK